MALREQRTKKSINKIVKPNGRVLRSRQYKRSFEEIRPVKRLFTPEIKRHLKSWLIRRRENPYPNREEKIELAVETGLTYIQICNWFANWRRKLKNSGKSINKDTWSTLIKSYNDQAFGNVEHLSISSDDSIWEEPDQDQIKSRQKNITSQINYSVDHCYTSLKNVETFFWDEKSKVNNHLIENRTEEQAINTECLPQCFQISSTTDFITEILDTDNKDKLITSKKLKDNPKNCSRYLNKRQKSAVDKNWNYKKIMDKTPATKNHADYEQDCQVEGDPNLLTKWRKSAALFQPSCKNYSSLGCLDKEDRHFKCESFHGKEELDAAEALTFLSRASANRFL